MAEPKLLRFVVGSAQPLAGPLHAEAELVQQLGHVLPIVRDTEALLDQRADHTRRPDATVEPRSFRTVLDQPSELLHLLVGEPAPLAWCLPRV
jgi:hypothetical protein